VHDGQHIDLVYNRCTDFYFADAAHAALAEAYAARSGGDHAAPVSRTRCTRTKDNLVLLSDAATLRSMGAADADIEILTRAIPRTLRVTQPEQRWWDERKQWFFKPTSGFWQPGVRIAVTRSRAAPSVMSCAATTSQQQIAPPSERQRGAMAACFKLDVRNYVYDGMTQLMAARLFQGQTTNFRTAGGGFAPVYQLA
jgi:hypothetical protein